MPSNRKTPAKPRNDPLGIFACENRHASKAKALKRGPDSLLQIDREKLISARAIRPALKRFHGLKIPLVWFPWRRWRTPCSDKFGYISSKATLRSTKHPFTPATREFREISR